jgi:hypothetical protein
MYMPARKKDTSFPVLIKKNKISKKVNKPILFTLKLGYLAYIKNKAYQHYMDNMSEDIMLNDMDFETQMVFTSHYFNNYVEQENIENQEIKIYQDNMYKILNELSITMFHLANDIGIHQKELLNHFLDTQIHLDKTEKFKLNNIKFLLLRRIEATMKIYDKKTVKKEEKQVSKK